MDVSLRHWPIFITGLLLGAAGAMSLGLHRPTQAELAASAPPTAATPAGTAAIPASATTVVQIGPQAIRTEVAEEQMRAAAQAFRAHEALAATAAPFALALAEPPKTRVRRAVAQAQAPAIAALFADDSAVANAPYTAPERSESVATLRTTSVMGAAPARRSAPGEAAAEQAQPARGSAHAIEGGETGPRSE